MNDYVFRGITQSNHKPSVAAYFEPRYNVNANLQLYAGVAGESISSPNDASGGNRFLRRRAADLRPVRARFRLLVLLLSGRDLLRRHARCGTACANGDLPNGNVAKADASFYEVYGKADLQRGRLLAFGANVYYTPNVPEHRR